MSHLELPLVFFTVLSQAAIGLVVLNALLRLPLAAGLGPQRIFCERQTALILLALALFCSLFHLGHPSGAWRAMDNLAHSWLSREILAFSIMFILLAAAAGLSLAGKSQPLLWKAVAVIGILGLAVQGASYTPPSQPTLAGGVTLAMFLITVFAVGTAINSWYAPNDRQPVLAAILAGILVLGLVLNLLLPEMWRAGTPVAAATGQAYLASPLYWGQMLMSFILPLLVLARYRRIPHWLVWMILCGEIIGRMAFFSLPITTAARIGMQI